MDKMLRTFEFVKYGVKSETKTGKTADGQYELKNRTYYAIKFSVNIVNYAIYLLVLWGIIYLFI
jgi:hypothetical protein